jgi:hypothetical protein
MIKNKYIISGIFILFIISNISISVNTESLLDNYDAIILNYEFPDPIIQYLDNYDETFLRVTINGLSNTYDYKKPCIPIKPIRVILPYGQEVCSISVKTSEEKSIGFSDNIEVAGLLTPIMNISNKVYSNKEILVCKDTYQDIYSNVGIYKCRGFSILHLNIYPINYDIQTGEIVFYENIQIKINTINSGNIKKIRGLPEDFEIIEKLVENPSIIETYKNLDVNIENIQTYEYIIITGEKFLNANGEYNFEDLIQYKIDKGTTAGIFTVEDIVNNDDYGVYGPYGDANPDNPFYETEITENIGFFNDAAARIRNFIRYAYSELGTNYVLLAGDADEIVPNDNILPCRKLFADEDGLPLPSYGVLEHEEDDIPSDVYYACLDGNFNYDCDLHFGESPKYCNDGETDEADLFSEVWVGRACVDSIEEISNFVMKTLYYEENNDDYLSKILFVGEYLGFPGVSAYGGNYKDYVESQLTIPTSYNIEKIYDREEEWYPYELIPYISENLYHIINHDGHGNHYYILKTNGDTIREFTNEKPFFLYSHSCLTGSFDNYNCWYGYQNYDCIAEVLTCEIPYGAFACILNARFGLGSEDSLESPSGAYDESFFKAIFEENIREIGRASHYSKEYYINQINENGMRWTYYQTNLFGDPELKIKNYNNPPRKPFKPSGESSGKTGDEYIYKTSTSDPDGDQIWYKWDWGDGSDSEWIGPYDGGVTISTQYSWDEQGDYVIKVKAKDSYGDESPWSDPLTVKMPLSKINYKIQKILLWLNEQSPFLK